MERYVDMSINFVNIIFVIVKEMFLDDIMLVKEICGYL